MGSGRRMLEGRNGRNQYGIKDSDLDELRAPTKGSVAAKSLPPSQAAALARLKSDGTVHWSATSPAEARALNALVDKGLARKVTIDETVTVYQLAVS